VSAGGRLFSVQVPDWGQDHLSAEAVAAYVDGELADRPYGRATRHLATCSECAAQVVAQGQARAALRSARCPSLPSSLMSTLRSIPQDTDLPGPPNGLAIGPDGELVSRLRPDPRPAADPSPPAGLATTPTTPATPAKARRSRIGASAAISGLALGALAIGAAIIAGDTPAPSGLGDPPSIDAHLQLPGTP
jgi:Putative zinc-finger